MCSASLTKARSTRTETKISSVAFTFGNRAIFGRKTVAESEREKRRGIHDAIQRSTIRDRIEEEENRVNAFAEDETRACPCAKHEQLVEIAERRA